LTFSKPAYPASVLLIDYQFHTSWISQRDDGVNRWEKLIGEKKKKGLGDRRVQRTLTFPEPAHFQNQISGLLYPLEAISS
jgi:hypothetical protein